VSLTLFGKLLRHLDLSPKRLGPIPSAPDPHLIFSTDDNRLKTRRKGPGCTDYSWYYTDQAGNRIAQRDTLNGGSTLRTQKMTYTAANQLYYSLTATEALALYDANWHWYDASGMRIMTHAQQTNNWYPTFQPDSGFRTFYYYDGSDVALTVVRGNANNYWVGQRYLTGGIDAQMAGRFTNTGGAVTSLVMVGGQNGTAIVNVKANGTEDVNSSVITRGPFGTLEGGGSVPSTNAQTGFAGASTPNQTGGFVYLRNRWYDPKTGRFLTQDPIGLAGGVNLYAYAGNNPVIFSDPFGLLDVTVEGENSKKVVAFLLATSPSFKKIYDDLDANHDIHLTIRDGGPGEPNHYHPESPTSGTVIYNQALVDEDNAKNATKRPWVATDVSAVAHEVGHAAAWLSNGRLLPHACNSEERYGGPACIMDWENKVRHEVGPATKPNTRTSYFGDERDREKYH
jgi:RHS repeat-associated protein